LRIALIYHFFQWMDTYKAALIEGCVPSTGFGRSSNGYYAS
jgi:hypothetical protein